MTVMRSRLGRWVRKLADRLDPPVWTVQPDPQTGGATIWYRNLRLVEIGRTVTANDPDVEQVITADTVRQGGRRP